MRINLTPGGWARLAIYALAALVGVASFAARLSGNVELSTALDQLMEPLIVIVGGTAAANLGKAPDQQASVLERLIRDVFPGMRVAAPPAQDGLPAYAGPTTADIEE